MNLDPTASRLAAAGVAYAPEISGAARRHGIDPGLLAAVAAQETGGPDANAGRNELGDDGHGHGIFQIDDRWHEFARTPAAMDPQQNADYAAGMLQGLLSRYGGDVHEALSAYNAGDPKATGTTTRWGDGTSLGYADSVLRHYHRLTGGSPPTAPPSGASPRNGGPEGGGNGSPGNGDATRQLLAELSALIASLGALDSPMLQAPQMQQPPQPYQQQVVDYAGLLDNGDN